MTVPNFMSKAFSYQDLRKWGRGWALCAPPVPKCPGADRVKLFEQVYSYACVLTSLY